MESEAGPTLDSGSFRDRDARVFVSDDGRILRGLSADAEKEWAELKARRFFARFHDDGRLVSTKDAADAPTLPGDWARILEHERVPFVSYAYEWSFGMLKDAALLQLELLAEALEEGMILIDASSFNVQWRGAKPVFIDVPSIRRIQPGQPWVGYRQFCQMHLFPLFLRAYKDVDFIPWLRGSIDGITPTQCNQMMSWRDLFRSGVFSHVYLHSKLEQRYGQTERKVGDELKSSGFNDELIKANVAGLRKLVSRLTWKASQSEWSDYTRIRSYSDQGLQAKKGFVDKALASQHWQMVWDLGCNTGEFSEMAAAHADTVVAMDADQLAVDLLYRRLREGGPKNVLPLVGNLADPSPAIGWRNRERKTLPERGRPDLVMSLALIHHVVLGANIPVEEYVDWLAGLTRRGLIIEFVNRHDPMVKILLRNKEDKFADYQPEHFEQCLERRFEVVSREEIDEGKRFIYFATVR